MKKVLRRKRAVPQEWSVGIRAGMDLAGFCEKRRDELGLTQAELAARIGKTGAWLSLAEKGRGLLVSDLVRLLSELGVEEVVFFVKS